MSGILLKIGIQLNKPFGRLVVRSLIIVRMGETEGTDMMDSLRSQGAQIRPGSIIARQFRTETQEKADVDDGDEQNGYEGCDEL